MSKPIPDGLSGFIPHLCCVNCTQAIEFYKKAFGAIEIYKMMAPDQTRVMHAAMMIGENTFYLVDDFPEYCGGKSQTALALGGSPVTIHRYVENCDRVIDQAVMAGAMVLMPAQDMFWGDRYGAVVDPFGHKWSLATHLKDLSPEEMKKGMDEAFASPVDDSAKP